MELEKTLQERFSCRRFLDRPVSLEQVRAIASLAQRVPSWGNTQPWKLYAVAGDKARAIRENLVTALQAGGPQSPDMAMPTSFEGELMDRYRDLGRAMFKVLGIGRDDHNKRAAHYANNFDGFGAPCLLYVTVPKGQTNYVVLDAGAYVTGLCLAATSLGLATCALAALARFPEEVRKVVPIPTSEAILVGVALGYADTEAPAYRFRSERLPLEQVLTSFDL
ncbi:MAG: nitroreductase [Thermodesulfobacteriota bacterium]